MNLMFIHMEGCGACESAKPHLQRWLKKHPEVNFASFDLLNDRWMDPSWKPEATPTYVIQFPNHQRIMWVGALKEREIDQFVQTAKNRLGVR
jgi:hypothetical protein